MINLDERDKDLKHYVDMKIRALRKQLTPFIWMSKYPKKALLILFVFVLLCISIASSIDLRKLIMNKFGIELDETRSTP